MLKNVDVAPYVSLCDGHKPQRGDYSHLRRPFFGGKGTHAVDVWTYPSVEHFKGQR